MDLKTKLAFALVSVCLLSMGALGYFTYVWADGMFLEDSQRRLEARAESRETELQGIFDAWTRELQALVTRTGLPERTRSYLDAPDADSLARIARLLEDANAASESIRELTLLDSEGRALSGAQPNITRSMPAMPDSRVAYAGARKLADESVGIVFHAPVVLEGQRIGFVEAVFGADALAGSVGTTADIGDSGETLVAIPTLSADETGYFVLAAPAPGADSDHAKLTLHEVPAASPTALAWRDGLHVAVSARRGHEVMATTGVLPDSGVAVLVQVDRAEMQARADRLLGDMRDLGSAVAAFAILGGTLLGFRLARPINRLVEEVDRIRHGEIDLRLDVKGEDEVAFLAMSLNEFMDQLDRSSDLFQLGGRKLLVVDGDPESRRVLQELLQHWNLQPTSVERKAAAVDAIEAAEREGHPFEIIVVDETTTDTCADDLAETLRASNRHACPIIMLSADADAEPSARESSTKTNHGHVLPKPVIASHLMEAILSEMGVTAQGLEETADVYLKKTTPRKILLAEDSRLIQQVMRGFLENWGHQVVSAENGRLAVDRVQAERFDLVLMDVEMPEMNGLDATAAIRASEAEGERLPIIALTAEARSGDRERCLAAGMTDYLAKPADPRLLYAMIHRCPARVLAAEASDSAAPAPPPAEPKTANGGDPIDWEVARSLTGGDEQLLRETSEMFPEESRRQLEAIRTAIETGDAEQLTRGAHTLKGTAGLFGASALVEVALEMERLGREAQLGSAGLRLEALEAETSRVCAALSKQENA